MNDTTVRWTVRYGAALRKHLKGGIKSILPVVEKLGVQAVALKLETLDVARIHEKAMLTMAANRRLPINQRAITQANRFFTGTIVPIEHTHLAAVSNDACVKRLTGTVHRRTQEAIIAARNLKHGIDKRLAAEKVLKTSGRHHQKLLRQSDKLQQHVRLLTRNIISVQEDQRFNTSHRLHNEIAQILAAVNLRLGILKNKARTNTEGLHKEIADTQRLVVKSTNEVVHFVNENAKQNTR
ncbi:MAG: hypothetical protein A2340_08445 [Lentisphaerae bacterium RIFOXYB12_FULL_60_10]|nr:MAG: hypothetical protein A2340_08445 [Lentisphaerae bacterium RIFOXYB12_FULL_60_10]